MSPLYSFIFFNFKMLNKFGSVGGFKNIQLSLHSTYLKKTNHEPVSCATSD